ncbi:acetolactate decarboxylase [soil metagenome]
MAPVDQSFVRAMHVQTLQRAGIHERIEPGVLFQASTIGALLDGAYDGDISFGELAEHGNLGLGTLNGLDGEMIALGGRFYRADVDGVINEIDPETKTPFAVVVPFEAADEFDLPSAYSHQQLLDEIDRRSGPESRAWAFRIDGRFASVKARSVPRQQPPYRPLADVIGGQHVFELDDVEGTMVGFRFPDHSDGIEAPGYHLHFIDSARTRGGHVLDCRLERGRVQVDPSSRLRVELPPGVDLAEPHLELPLGDALRMVEGS